MVKPIRCMEIVRRFIDVVKPSNTETTVLGAAFAAGIGVGLWPNEDALPTLEASVFMPSISEDLREKRMRSWKKAIERSLNWVEKE